MQASPALSVTSGASATAAYAAAGTQFTCFISTITFSTNTDTCSHSVTDPPQKCWNIPEPPFFNDIAFRLFKQVSVFSFCCCSCVCVRVCVCVCAGVGVVSSTKSCSGSTEVQKLTLIRLAGVGVFAVPRASVAI
jgi:hypothetical protein